MKSPRKPVTAESLQTGMAELREYVETTEFAKKPEKKPKPVGTKDGEG